MDELLVPLLPGHVLIVGQDRRLLGAAPCRADFGQSAFVSGQVMSEIIQNKIISYACLFILISDFTLTHPSGNMS